MSIIVEQKKHYLCVPVPNIPETGLICHYLTCNATGVGCTEETYENQYCNGAFEDQETIANTHLHLCQVLCMTPVVRSVQYFKHAVYRCIDEEDRDGKLQKTTETKG